MIQPSGGRAGVHGLKWLNAGYNLQQIELLRQQLLAQKDIGRVQRAMRQFGITVKRDVIQLVKQYNFDSHGIAFTEENYSAWRRLATGKGTIGDVAYMIHEIAEVEELQQVKSQTGFDFMRRKKEKKSRRESGRWQTDFDRYYRQAHSKALEAEYEFIAKQVYNVTNGVVKISKLQAAAIDPTRNEEAWEHLFVDGRPMQEHHHFYVFCKRAKEVVHIGASTQQRLRYYQKEITLKELIRFVKRIPISDWRT